MEDPYPEDADHDVSDDEKWVDPEQYPATCTISAEEMRELRDVLTDEDNERLRCWQGEWPPRDDLGNVMPLTFTAEDLDEKGNIEDKHGSDYNPLAGNLEPRIDVDHDGYCNAPLMKWRDRYPDIRYCSVALNAKKGYDLYCYFHQRREKMAKSAEEHLQSGLQVTTMDHLYEKVGPWKKLVGWGTFESLMGESHYDFAPEYQEREFDFSNEDHVPDGVDENQTLEVKCGYPTDHVQPAMALYVAAMQQVQMLSVQPRVMFEGTRPDGTEEGMMETKSVEKAQLTAPTDNDPTQQFRTIETWNEHHLNLPLSRLIKDQPRLLEMGGVTVDPEAEDDGQSMDDIVLEVEADVEGVETTDDTGTDPNQFGADMTSESQKIVDSASESTSSSSDSSGEDDSSGV